MHPNAVSSRVVGHVDVDSGTIMVIDPCYVLPDKRTGWPEHLPDGGDPSSWRYLHGDETSVYLSAVDSAWEKNSYGRGAGGFGEWGNGFITSTTHGDGSYPVVADFDSNGRILQITIDFDPSYDEDDEL